MSKRGVEELLGDEVEASKKQKAYEHVNKHTLDSDEEDSDVDESRYNVLDEDDIQGEEEGIAGIEGGVKLTPFNMKEELEEGHFDADGHYQWNKSKEIKDHWLDNLDWVKIKEIDQGKGEKSNPDEPTLGEASSDSEDEEKEDAKKFEVILAYRRILECMKPGESIQKTLQRLGKKRSQISSKERFERKKAGIVDEESALITELTELCNKILTKMGNMDIYQETYEQINAKFASKLKGTGALPATSSKNENDEDALDMYADDFDIKEKEKKTEPSTKAADEGKSAEQTTNPNDIQWEFKWKQDDTETHGPFSTQQMQHWVDQGYFKDGVFVKKSGVDSQFYSSNRVDFELYF